MWSSVSSSTRARAAAAGVLMLLLLHAAVSADAAALESADAAAKQTASADAAEATTAATAEATTAAAAEATTAATENVTSAASAVGPSLPPLPPPMMYPRPPPVTSFGQRQPASTVMAPEESLRSVKNGDIYSFIIHSKIKYRYAQTVVSSRVANKGNTSSELHFFVTLPESAFISKFLMEVGGKVFEAYVKEKNEAKEEYFTAVKLGQTAAHVEQNTRDSNQFTVSVNVESESKVTFNLTYEQLLTRKLGFYENVMNLLPGQVVKNLQVIVDIEESSNITTLEVPDIKTVNEIETTTSKNKLAQISRESGNKATITWSPTPTEQLTFTKLGVKGQFIVQYDVDHKSTPNQVLIDDGYFVHFFAPTDLKPLRTHVIFVLDVSGSMVGQKLPQLKEAMEQILSEIHPDDFFTLILFSDYAQIWTINATQQTYTRWDAMGSVMKANNSGSVALGEQRYVFPATEQNVQYAKKFIQDLVSEGSTNMEDALAQAYDIAKLGKIRFENGPNTPKPIILFLTDGEPTFGITDPQELVKYVSNINVEKYPIFSLGFGDGADIDFLKKLSLNNTGFARVIYEASDASLQLRNFYKEISSPVLSNVTFQYVDTQVDNITVTKKSFNLLFKGTELVVAGRLKDPKSELNSTLDADSTDGKFQGPIIVTCFDFPIIPPESAPQVRKIGHLERLWAYLYIQQLMDQYELNKNENSTEKAKALELALKYSFVTPLTSLVVVKPNDTKTSADPEKIKPIDNKYNFDSFIMASSPGLFQSGSASLANSAAASSYIHPVSLKLGVPGPPMYAMKPISTTFDFAAIETADFASTTHSMDIFSSVTLHNIDELKWLNVSNNTEPSITLNTTNSVYQVSLNTTGQSYQNCTMPTNFVEGTCKHLKDCIIDSILNSFEEYIPLFCAINNIYAGICCPV